MTLLLTRSTFAQSSGSGEEGEAGATGGIPIPLDPLSIYIQSQSPIIEAAYCLGPQLDLWIFELESSPIEFDFVAGDAGDDQEIAHWRTFSFYEYDWNSGNLDPQMITNLNTTSSRAALLLGDFEGPCGTISSVGLWMSFVDDLGTRHHYLIPMVQLSVEVSDVMHLALIYDGPETVDPCIADELICDATYRNDLASALDAYNICMANNVPPFNLWNVACFVGCAPLITGGPAGYALYAACTAACNGGVAVVGTVINSIGCSSDLSDAQEDARNAFCDCQAWKAANCPNRVEPDPYGLCP